MKQWLVKVVSVLMVLCLLTGAAFADEMSDQKLDACYTLAINSISAADYEKAMTYLDDCLKYCGANNHKDIYADIFLKKGCVLTIEKQYDEALVQLDNALAVSPDLYEANLVKSQVYTETEQYGAAIEALKLYIDASGDDTMNVSLAELYKLSGDETTGEQVLADYETALAAAKELYESGSSKMEAGDYAGAAQDFIACSDNTTYGAGARYCAGVCLINTGDYANALGYLESALINGITIDGIYYNCGLCRMMCGDFSNAIIYFTASVNVESFVEDAVYNRGVCYLNSAAYDEGAADFTEYLVQNIPAEDEELDADFTKALYFRAMCELLGGKYAEAEADFTACAQLGFEEDACKVNLTLCYVQTGEYAKAVASATECLDMGISVAECSYYRGVAYANLGYLDDAIADFTTCIDMEYDLANIYYQRAQIYKALGENEKYIADLESSVNA